jgi:hypothetical protein
MNECIAFHLCSIGFLMCLAYLLCTLCTALLPYQTLQSEIITVIGHAFLVLMCYFGNLEDTAIDLSVNALQHVLIPTDVETLINEGSIMC